MAAPVETQTWHYGLVARWWAEFNVAEPHELAYYREAIGRFGEPAIDLGCGTGRYVVPLSAEGLDVDGVDVSADMIALATAQAEKAAATPRLYVQPLAPARAGAPLPDDVHVRRVRHRRPARSRPRSSAPDA